MGWLMPRTQPSVPVASPQVSPTEPMKTTLDLVDNEITGATDSPGDDLPTT